MLDYYNNQIRLRKEANQYRQFNEFIPISSTRIKKNGVELISFCSNDYLGLAHNKKIIEEAHKVIDKYGIGSGSSRFVAGNYDLYNILEQKIADIKKSDDALIFSSGYSCAIGVLPALVKKGDLIIADRLIHSCLIDGAVLSGAKILRFKHNDYEHCRELLINNRVNYDKVLIVSESVFSMDGDKSDIKKLLNIAKNFDSLLLIDYAHDIKLSDDFQSDNLLKMGTFSKAFGALGGYIAGNKILIDYLRNFSKSLIYSTALPPVILASIYQAIEIMKNDDLANIVIANAEYFCNLVNLAKPESAIIPIIIGDEQKTIDIAKKVEENGYLISAIRPPTVEKGKSRLRITFNSEHQKKDIEELARLINVFC